MSDQRRYLSVEQLPVQQWIRPFTPLDRTLWIVVLGASAADMILTLIGLELCFTEANPVAAAAISSIGPAGLLLLKGSAIFVLYVVVKRLSDTYSLAALFGFSLPQVFATGMNSLLLLNHAGSCPGV